MPVAAGSGGSSPSVLPAIYKRFTRRAPAVVQLHDEKVVPSFFSSRDSHVFRSIGNADSLVLRREFRCPFCCRLMWLAVSCRRPSDRFWQCISTTSLGEELEKELENKLKKKLGSLKRIPLNGFTELFH